MPACRIGKDGKPTFERTGVVNETPTPPPSASPGRDPWFANRDAAVPSSPADEAQRPQFNELSFRQREPEPEQMARMSDYVPTVECASCCP